MRDEGRLASVWHRARRCRYSAVFLLLFACPALFPTSTVLAATVEVAPTLEYFAFDRDTAPRGPYASEEAALNAILPSYVQQYYFPGTGETRYYDYPTITDKSPYTKTINGNWSWSRAVYLRQLVRSVFDNGNYFEYFISTNTACMLYYQCPASFTFKESFSTWDIGQPGPTCVGEGCPVGKLTTTHVSYPLNTDQLTDRAKQAVDCLESCSGRNRTQFLSSAYRPSAYQDHLREVWGKWRELEFEPDPDCGVRREEVKKEFNDHGLGASTLRPSKSSCHSSTGGQQIGSCFDVHGWFMETVDFCSTQCNVYRPWPGDDPVHVLPF